MMEHWLVYLATIHKWYPFPNAFISFNYVVSYFNFCYLHFQQEIKLLANSL